MSSQPAPPSHLEKHRANTGDCKKEVEKGLSPWEMCSGHLDGHGSAAGMSWMGYSVSKRWVRKVWCDFFGWLGSYCQKWILLGLKLGLKNMSLLAPDRDASWNLETVSLLSLGGNFGFLSYNMTDMFYLVF